jgi:hypothetical protein
MEDLGGMELNLGNNNHPSSSPRPPAPPGPPMYAWDFIVQRILALGFWAFIVRWSVEYDHETIILFSTTAQGVLIAIAGVSSNFSASSETLRGFIAISTTYAVVSTIIYAVLVYLITKEPAKSTNPPISVRCLFAAGNACLGVSIMALLIGTMLWFVAE